jgi:hypothetical protein
VGGAITDGSKGDINVSGGGSTWTIADDAVTLGKMAPLATDRLIGRDTTGTDNPEAISVTGGIEFTGSQSIQVSAFSGDVNKPAGSTTTTITAGAVSTSKLGGDITTQGKALLDDATAADQRTTLGLGTIATQNANNVSISGGSITGITDLAVADGGTGSSTASGARSNLLPSYTGNGGKVLAVNTGATDVEWITASGGDALTNENISPTTANPTVTVNKRYFATIAGLTANRDFVLPTPAVGNQIELSIVDGDDTYALIIKGASGVTINGGSAATEWSRLFIKGEVVRFVANTTSNWQVVTDGRIPSLCRLGRASVQTFTTGTITNVAINSVTFDNGSLAKTSYSTTLFGTADAIVPRRTNKYIVTAGFRLTTLTAASNRVAAWFVDDNNVIWQFCELTAGNASAPGLALVTTAELTAGVALILRAAQYSGADQNTSSVPYPHLAITEVLS